MPDEKRIRQILSAGVFDNFKEILWARQDEGALHNFMFYLCSTSTDPGAVTVNASSTDNVAYGLADGKRWDFGTTNTNYNLIWNPKNNTIPKQTNDPLKTVDVEKGVFVPVDEFSGYGPQ